MDWTVDVSDTCWYKRLNEKKRRSYAFPLAMIPTLSFIVIDICDTVSTVRQCLTSHRVAGCQSWIMPCPLSLAPELVKPPVRHLTLCTTQGPEHRSKPAHVDQWLHDSYLHPTIAIIDRPTCRLIARRPSPRLGKRRFPFGTR